MSRRRNNRIYFAMLGIALVVSVMLSILQGCCPRAARALAAPERDSIVITNVVHDTEFVVRPDSSMIRALLEADSVGHVHLKEIEELKSGKNIRVPHIAIKDNVLTVTAQVDSFAVAAKWNERHIKETNTKPVIQTVIKKVNHVNTIQKTMMWFGGVFILLIVIAIILKIKKIGI